MEGDLREGLRRRGAAAVADRLEPLAVRFRDELLRLRHASRSSGPAARGGGTAGAGGEGNESETRLAYLAGLDSLQEASQRIFDDEIGRVATGRGASLLAAAVGTTLFWGLLAGPIIALYRTYFGASVTALRSAASGIDAFPHPPASTMLTSVALSTLPVALFAMAAMSFAQGRRRVRHAEARIRAAHAETIESLQREGVLRLRWDDPLLADAEFLLSAGDATPFESDLPQETSR